MVPELDWDDEETQVKDRSDVAATGDLARSGPRRTASGVVAVRDLRSTIVMREETAEAAVPPNAAVPPDAPMPPDAAGAEPTLGALDPRGTVRIVDEGRRERLRRTTVRATREEIFGAAPPTWEDDDPDVHLKRRFEAMVAEVVARSETATTPPGEPARREIAHGAFALPAHRPAPIAPAKKTMIGLGASPEIAAADPRPMAFTGEPTAPSLRRVAVVAAADDRPRQQRAARRARVAAQVT